AECAARRPVNRAWPGTGDVVVRPADDPVRVIWINCNRRLVLCRGGRILIHQDVRRDNGGAVERTGKHVRRRDRRERSWQQGARFLRFLLNERGEPDPKTLHSIYSRDLAGQRVDVESLRRPRDRARWADRNEGQCPSSDQQRAGACDAQMREETISVKPRWSFHIFFDLVITS